MNKKTYEIKKTKKNSSIIFFFIKTKQKKIWSQLCIILQIK